MVWGDPVGQAGPGVYVVEVPEKSAAAPLDVGAITAWIERVPSLRHDRARPSAPDLAARLASLWIPGEAVVYVVASAVPARRSGGRRGPDPHPDAIARCIRDSRCQPGRAGSRHSWRHAARSSGWTRASHTGKAASSSGRLTLGEQPAAVRRHIAWRSARD